MENVLHVRSQKTDTGSKMPLSCGPYTFQKQQFRGPDAPDCTHICLYVITHDQATTPESNWNGAIGHPNLSAKQCWYS